MKGVDTLLMRMFGRPRGLLGRLGGFILAQGKGRFTAWVIELLDIRAGDRVLEVGFGPGVAIRRLTESTQAGAIAGIDGSREMVEQAAARNAKAIAAGRVDIRRGFAERLPFPDETFDKALSINSLQVWSDPKAGLCEIRRVLKTDGRLALGFTAHARQQKAGLPEQLTAAGFSEARLVETAEGFCVLARK